MDSKISEIMIKDVTGLDASANLQDALRMMKTSKMSHLLVSDEYSSLVGVIAKQDILDHLLDVLSRTTGRTYTSLELNAILVSRVMSSDPICLKETDTVAEAIRSMAENHIKCLPVVNDENKVLGIITSHDVLKYINNKN